jgi:hypothetical protein
MRPFDELTKAFRATVAYGNRAATGLGTKVAKLSQLVSIDSPAT